MINGDISVGRESSTVAGVTAVAGVSLLICMVVVVTARFHSRSFCSVSGERREMSQLKCYYKLSVFGYRNTR